MSVNIPDKINYSKNPVVVMAGQNFREEGFPLDRIRTITEAISKENELESIVLSSHKEILDDLAELGFPPAVFVLRDLEDEELLNLHETIQKTIPQIKSSMYSESPLAVVSASINGQHLPFKPVAEKIGQPLDECFSFLIHEDLNNFQKWVEVSIKRVCGEVKNQGGK